MIMHYMNSLDSLHYCIDVFDVNTGIWWHCDDDESTQIGEFPEGVYTRDIHLRFLLWVGDISIFQIKYERKRLSREVFPIPQAHIPCLLLRVAKFSILV